MAENDKRYYWLKLKEDYLNSPKIKKLRKIAGGDTYTIIYLKMQLLSIKNGGLIEYEQIEPTFEEELALKLDEDTENVAVTLSYLQSQNLVDLNDKNEYLLLEATNNIGSESESAERVRRFRAKEEQKALHCNGCVTECNGCVTQVKQISISNSNSKSNIYNINRKEEQKEKEKVEEKHKYGEYGWVKLTEKQYNNLKAEFGDDYIDKVITAVDEYVQSNGNKNKYKDFNLVIRRAIREKWSIIKEITTEKEKENDIWEKLGTVY